MEPRKDAGMDAGRAKVKRGPTGTLEGSAAGSGRRPAGSVRAGGLLPGSAVPTAAVLEGMPDGVMLVDMGGRVTYVNRACEKLLGYRSEELVGTSAVDIPTYRESKDKTRAREALKRVIEKGIFEPIDIVAVRKDGTDVPIAFTASVIRDSEGRPLELVAVLREITERKRIEEALRESEELSRGMLETAATGIYLLQDGCFQYVNPVFEKMSGYTSGELRGTYSLDYVHPEDREAVRDQAIEALKGRSSLPYEFRLVRKDSETIWVLDTVSSIHYKGRRSVLGAITDITERKRAEAEVIDYTRQLETLFNIGTTVSQTLNLNELLEYVLQSVLGVIGVEAGGIFLFDTQTNELVLRSHRGLSAQFARDVQRTRVGSGFARRSDRLRRPIIVGNIAADPRFGRTSLKEEGFQSLAGIPIMARDRFMGVLNVVSRERRDFPEGEVRLLEAIASQVGVAIENAQLYEQALELAFTDGLTNLYNRRYLMEQIEREFSRAERSKEPLSLIMIDLDGLKSINDRYGHHEGDVFLIELAKIVKDNTRASDVAARWGGDEFMLLTYETEARGARKIGERIRSSVERCRVMVGGEKVAMSISVGIASYPAHASNVTDLLRRVDEAMYSAKRGGKNRLCVCTT